MSKLWCAYALVAMLMTSAAYADGRCCCSGSASPAAVVAAPSPVAQAQNPQSNRSYSYQPSINANAYRPVYRGLRTNAGMRAADSKATFNY